MDFDAGLDISDQLGSIISAICAVLGIVLSWKWARTVRARPRWLPVGRLPARPVQRLIEAQRVAAEQAAYEPWHIGQPPLGEIYVEQQTEAIASGHVAMEAARFDVHEMLARFHDAVLVGGPGTGKSTLAKNVVRESAGHWAAAGRFRRRSARWSDTVAVRIQASGLAQADGETLADALAQHCTAEGIPLDAEHFRRRPARGAEWLILLDGVDEISSPAARSRLLTLVRHELTGRNRSMRLVVTSRSPLEDGVPATELRLCVFDEARLEEFAGKWFRCRRNPDPSGEAGRFLARFGRGPLANLIRVPLMAAMAAVIHEFDRAARLPTSRTELYAQFVDVLRRSRGRRPAYVPDDAGRWLADNLDRLLAVAAREMVRSGPGDPFGPVVLHCAEQAPRTISLWFNSAEGRAALRENLLATSLVVSDGAALAFIHHSVAEFLAAPAQPVDLPGWLTRLGDPNTRSFSLFCVAHAGLAEAAIRSLLGGPVSDPVRAGHLLLDGAVVEPITQRQVVRELSTCLVSGGAGASEALTLLAGLAVVDPEVADWLSTVAGSPHAPAWPRTLISDMIADVDARRGEKLLINVAADRRIGTACRRWAAQRLVGRGSPMGRHLLNGVETFAGPATSDDETGTSLTAIADRQIAMDGRHAMEVRGEAAVRLADDPQNDDPRLQDVLRHLCRDGEAPAGLRRKAATAVARYRGPDGIRVILNLLREPSTPGDTVAAVIDTLAVGDSAGADLLLAMATDRTFSRATRTSILVSARQTGDWRLPREVALDAGSGPDLRMEAVRFFRHHGGGHDVMHALCVDREAPRSVRVLVMDTIRHHRRCQHDSLLLLQVVTDPEEDGALRYRAAEILLDRGELDVRGVLHDMATGRNADTWLADQAAGLLRAQASSAPPAEAAEQSQPRGKERPDARNRLPDDPKKVRALVVRASADLDLRKAAVARLLDEDESSTLDWLTRVMGYQDGTGERDAEDPGWLRDLVVGHLIGRPELLDRCRAMVLDPSHDARTRGRLAMHLALNGRQSDLTLVRPLVLHLKIDNRVRESILNQLLQRNQPDDVVVLVDVATQSADPRLVRRIVETLLMAGAHLAVRRVWPILWNEGCALPVRLAVGEALAYAGGRADHDQLRQLISTAVTNPVMRLRCAEILSHRGDERAREVLRGLACDNTMDVATRTKALALIAVPRDAGDVQVLRRVAFEQFAPRALRAAALRSLGNIGDDSERSAIQAIGRDRANTSELRRLAGETLAQLGDEAGLEILDDLMPVAARTEGRFHRVREIIRQ